MVYISKTHIFFKICIIQTIFAKLQLASKLEPSNWYRTANCDGQTTRIIRPTESKCQREINELMGIKKLSTFPKQLPREVGQGDIVRKEVLCSRFHIILSYMKNTPDVSICHV